MYPSPSDQGVALQGGGWIHYITCIPLLQQLVMFFLLGSVASASFTMAIGSGLGTAARQERVRGFCPDVSDAGFRAVQHHRHRSIAEWMIQGVRCCSRCCHHQADCRAFFAAGRLLPGVFPASRFWLGSRSRFRRGSIGQYTRNTAQVPAATNAARL